MTEQLQFHFSLSCIGEGNGNPLYCSCLENPRDGEPGGLPSVGSHRVGHDGSDSAAAAAAGTSPAPPSSWSSVTDGLQRTHDAKRFPPLPVWRIKSTLQSQGLCTCDIFYLQCSLPRITHGSHFAFSSVQFSRSVTSNSLRPHESQHARPPCPSPTP